MTFRQFIENGYHGDLNDPNEHPANAALDKYVNPLIYNTIGSPLGSAFDRTGEPGDGTVPWGYEAIGTPYNTGYDPYRRDRMKGHDSDLINGFNYEKYYDWNPTLHDANARNAHLWDKIHPTLKDDVAFKNNPYLKGKKLNFKDAQLVSSSPAYGGKKFLAKWHIPYHKK